MNASTDSTPAVPRDAATVVLLRNAGEGLETLMLRRRATMSFAAGDWVFPGGVIDAADADPAWAPRVADRGAAGAAARDSAAAAASAVLVGACRETFEESGVLLGRYSDGRACAGELLYALQRERRAGADTPSAFRELLARHDLMLEPDRLAYWANWVTPAFSPKRFDTRFFIARMPPEQEFDLHESESQDARWVSVDAECGAAGLDPPVTAPPTLFTLREIARQHRSCGSLDALLDWAREQAPVAVMLKVRREGEQMLGILPWDPDYDSTPGDGVRCGEAQRARFAAFPSRIRVEPPVRPKR